MGRSILLTFTCVCRRTFSILFPIGRWTALTFADAITNCGTSCYDPHTVRTNVAAHWRTRAFTPHIQQGGAAFALCLLHRLIPSPSEHTYPMWEGGRAGRAQHYHYPFLPQSSLGMLGYHHLRWPNPIYFWALFLPSSG